jgi:serine/threonine-protein kinase
VRPVGSKYLLEEPLGRGATGTVWRARIRDDADGAAVGHVAIKVLKEELATDPDVVMRFLRERSVLLRLVHPNIVRVRDLVVEGELLALVMDLIEGPDLHRYLRDHGPLSPIAGALLMAQVADALAASHADGVVHRDLKPANVMMATARTPEGAEQMHPLLTDFGIARLADSPGLTRTHEFVGTPAYVAPESAAGRPQTEAVDIYGAGIMLYELVTGQPPFHGDGPLQILQAHLSREPERPRNLPEPLWIVIDRCLRKDPAQRPTAVALATALRTVAAGVGVHATPAQIDAALAVDALLAPPEPPSFGSEPTVPNGIPAGPRYDPGAATVFGMPSPAGAAEATQVLPPGGGFGPPAVPYNPPAPTTVLPAAAATQVLGTDPALGGAGAGPVPGEPGQPAGPHPWESQLRAARTRNEQTRVDYRFPVEAEPQPQVAPPPYRAPQPYRGPQPQPDYRQPQPDYRQPEPQYRQPEYQPEYQQPEPQRAAPVAERPASRAASRPASRAGSRPESQRERQSAPPREPVREPEPAPQREREARPARPKRRRRIPGGGCLRSLLVLAVIAAAVWYFTPAQHWVHNVEGWWNQAVHTWNSVTGSVDKAKKNLPGVFK